MTDLIDIKIRLPTRVGLSSHAVFHLWNAALKDDETLLNEATHRRGLQIAWIYSRRSAKRPLTNTNSANGALGRRRPASAGITLITAASKCRPRMRINIVRCAAGQAVNPQKVMTGNQSGGARARGAQPRADAAASCRFARGNHIKAPITHI